MGKLISKFFDFLNRAHNRIIETHRRGIEWIGLDGLANMESSALLVIFFMIFFRPLVSIILSFILMSLKCAVDKKKKHNGELRDFLMSVIGIAGGTVLGLAMLCVPLM